MTKNVSQADQEGSDVDWFSRRITIHAAAAAASRSSCFPGDGVGDDHDVSVRGSNSSVMPRQEPVLLSNLTSNPPSASKLLSGSPSMAVDDSSPLLVASGLIVKGVDGNKKAPASKLLSGGPSLAVGDSLPFLPISGAMAKSRNAPVSPMNLNSNAGSMSASQLFSGGLSSAVSSWTDTDICRYLQWPVLTSLPSSQPFRPSSSAVRPAPRAAIAAGFVAETTLANDLNRLHLASDRRGTSGLTLPVSVPPMNIPTDSSLFQTTAPGNNFSAYHGDYCIPPDSYSLFNINRDPIMPQFKNQCPAQGIFPNPHIGNSPIRGGEWRRINPQTAMFLPPANSSARSSADRVNDAAARLKYPGIYEEPRRAITVRKNSILEPWRRPYHTSDQWIDLYAQIDMQLQAQGAPTSISALLLRRYGGGRLMDPKDALYCIAQNKHACLVLQEKLQEGPHTVEMILDGVLDHAVELMVDTSGNYFMQKLIEACTQEQLMEIIFTVNRHKVGLVGVSLNAHGTRSVQALIRNLVYEQLIALVIAALRPGLLRLFNDPNGYHVVQTCLTYLKTEENAFIFDAAKKYCVNLSTHQQGCVMIQQCINYATGGVYELALLLEVVANGYELCRNQFGNYVVQYVLRRNNPAVTSELALHLRGRYVELSKDKYGSNVVEECLHKFSEEDQNVIIFELLSDSFGLLMQDPFANYVIQTACRCYKGPLKAELEASIYSHRCLASSPYCKGIFSKLKSKKRGDDF